MCLARINGGLVSQSMGPRFYPTTSRDMIRLVLDSSFVIFLSYVGSHVYKAWCKFFGVSGEAKLLPVVKQIQLGVFHPTILFFVID